MTPGWFGPFKSLPNPREVFAWGLYDTANQSFTLIIITLLFSLYVQTVVTVLPEPPAGIADAMGQIEAAMEGGATREGAIESLAESDAAAADAVRAYDRDLGLAERRGKWNWSLMHGISLIVVVVVSPVVGAIGDIKGWRKQILMGTGVVCSVLTCALGLVGPGMLLLAGTLYIAGNLNYQVGENFLASFLSDVSTNRNIGKVSAIGWTMGYLGALLLLIISAVLMVVMGWQRAEEWRPLFVFSGVWFAVGIIPAWIVLRPDEPQPALEGRGVLSQSFGRLAATARRAADYRQLAMFLVAFFVYGLGVQIIVGFASIIARDFGFGETRLVLFVLQLTVVAGATAYGTSLVQDRIGIKYTILGFLGVWMLSCGGLILLKTLYPAGGPTWPLWVIGNGLGVGLGGIGAASRGMVGRFTPPYRAGEFFGLWGMSYKLAGAIGVLSFGAVARQFGDLASLWLLFGFFAVGTLLLLPLDEAGGYKAARKSQRGYERLRAARAADHPAEPEGSS